MSAPSPTPSHLIDFFRSGQRLTFSKEAVIHTSDEKDIEPLFLIDSGYVKSYHIQNNGSLHILCLYGPEAVFPIAPLLRGNGRLSYRHRNTVYFESMTDSVLYARTAGELVRLLETNPRLYRDLSVLLIRNYDIYLSRLEGSVYKHAVQRIAYQLLTLVEWFGGDELYGQSIVAIPLTHQDLADSLGMARETVSREIEKLRSMGILEIKDRHIIISDHHKLEALTQE